MKALSEDSNGRLAIEEVLPQVVEAFRVENYNLAWLLLEKARKMQLLPEEIWELEALCLIKLGRLHDARAILGSALQRNPDLIAAKRLYENVITLIMEIGGTCVIVGEDGHDACVTSNLILFYVELGFKVFLSKTIIPADLVVITRFHENSALEAKSLQKGTPIHIYPYVGEHPEELCKKLADFPVTIFSPSAALLPQIGGTLNFLVPPPVAPSFWFGTSPIEREYRFAHIGHLKPPSKEPWKEREDLIAALGHPESYVWGRGWEKLANIAHPNDEISIDLVSKTYGRSKFALGLMYPFQIKSQTFSSRVWQAPLAGAALIGEKSMVAPFPGVYPLGLDGLEEKAATIKETPAEIQCQALAFWTAHWCQMRLRVFESFYYAPPRNSGVMPSDLPIMGNSYKALKGGVLEFSRIYS